MAPNDMDRSESSINEGGLGAQRNIVGVQKAL